MICMNNLYYPQYSYDLIMNLNRIGVKYDIVPVFLSNRLHVIPSSNPHQFNPQFMWRLIGCYEQLTW